MPDAPGDIHFQISHEGRLLADVCGVGSFRTRRDDFLRTNEWQLVAVTGDLQGRGPRFFHNGIKLPRHIRKAPPETPGKVANFGQRQIGSWGKPTYGHQRNYVGRIDEVMVFSRALDPAEMQQLYRASEDIENRKMKTITSQGHQCLSAVRPVRTATL